MCIKSVFMKWSECVILPTFKNINRRMKQILATLIIICALSFTSFAQQMREFGAFKKEAELKSAFLKFDMSSFTKGKVLFVYDTLERAASVSELNNLMKSYISIPKKAVIKKASETNNGWIQTFGIYKDDDALMYIRFSISPETESLEEVFVEKN